LGGKLIPVYSIAKPFLAQAVLELAVDLKAPVGDYVAGIAERYAVRRIEQLLNHTSGLADYGFLKVYHEAVEAREPAWSRERLFAECDRFPHVAEGFQYSNIGYLLLRMLVERQTGLPMFGALQQLVFEPLGLEGFAQWEAETDQVPGYDPRWVYSGTFLAEPEAIAPAFGALAKHRHDTFGLDQGIAAVNHENTGFDLPGYGFGFMCNGGRDGMALQHVGHGGGGPGFNLMVLTDVNTWRTEVEYSTTGFDQTEAIGRLRAKLAQN
jgi:CubicO group peptidase (beta-lactamase class C family)